MTVPPVDKRSVRDGALRALAVVALAVAATRFVDATTGSAQDSDAHLVP